MFRIECFCEDKNLPNVLRALAGLVRGQPSVMPVVNIVDERVSAKNGALRAATSGKLVDMLAAHLRQTHKDYIAPKEIADWLQKHGKSRLSTSYVASMAVDAGILKKTGKGAATLYQVANAFVNPKGSK